jgi:hypothetical protein
MNETVIVERKGARIRYTAEALQLVPVPLAQTWVLDGYARWPGEKSPAERAAEAEEAEQQARLEAKRARFAGEASGPDGGAVPPGPAEDPSPDAEPTNEEDEVNDGAS